MDDMKKQRKEMLQSYKDSLIEEHKASLLFIEEALQSGVLKKIKVTMNKESVAMIIENTVHYFNKTGMSDVDINEMVNLNLIVITETEGFVPDVVPITSGVCAFDDDFVLNKCRRMSNEEILSQKIIKLYVYVYDGDNFIGFTERKTK